MNCTKKAFAGLMAMLALVYGAQAADVSVKAMCEAMAQTGCYELTSNVTFRAENTYLLDGVICVDDGAVLTIEAGTVLRGYNENSTGITYRPGMLIVRRGGKLYANGTASSPIIFTDEWDNNVPGMTPGPVSRTWGYRNGAPSYGVVTDTYDYSKVGNLHGVWGGVVLCGRAFVNWDGMTLGDATISVEGLDAAVGATGGGRDDDDSSGSVKYIQIRYGGSILTSTKEINGFTMYGVGRGTELHHIEVFNNQDDAFEWFGGTVNAKYLVGWGAGDDTFDSDCGFRGKTMKFVERLLVFALFLAQGCDYPLGAKYSVANGRESTKATVDLANAAWRVAARVSSPIDVGKEMVGVAEEIGRAGDRDVLKKWIAERHESWVLSGVLAHLTVAATLDGDGNQASAWFAQARDESLRTTEWRYPLIIKPLSLAEASVSLLPTSTNDAASAINRLATWTDEKPTERIQGAAWACAYRAAVDQNEAEQTVFLGAAQRFAANLLSWEQMSVLAFTAPRIRADGMRTEWLKQADARTACLTNALVTGGGIRIGRACGTSLFRAGRKKSRRIFVGDGGTMRCCKSDGRCVRALGGFVGRISRDGRTGPCEKNPSFRDKSR